MGDKEKQWLISSIKTLLLPAFEQCGFIVQPLEVDELRSELRRLMPFGRLRREGLHGVDLIEVQINKYRPSFSLNMGRVPPNGATSANRHISTDSFKKVLDIDVSFTTSTLFQKFGWFSVWHWPWKKVNAADYDDLVVKVIKLIPEIEQALREGKCGSHIKLVDLRGRLYYGESNSDKAPGSN